MKRFVNKKDRSKVRELFGIVKSNPRNYRYLKSYINGLIKEGVDISYQDYAGNTLLHLAVKLKDIKLLKLFIDLGVNVNIANENRMVPLHNAILLNRLDMVDLLIESGTDIESPMELEQTPLHLAVSLGELEIVKYLVSMNANINMVD